MQENTRNSPNSKHMSSSLLLMKEYENLILVPCSSLPISKAGRIPRVTTVKSGTCTERRSAHKNTSILCKMNKGINEHLGMMDFPVRCIPLLTQMQENTRNSPNPKHLSPGLLLVKEYELLTLVPCSSLSLVLT